MERNYYLRFEYRKGSGPKDQFFHFMWGYLLPALNQIFVLQQNSSSRKSSFFIESCGPVMDGVLVEMFDKFDFDYEIVRDSSLVNDVNEIDLPRWDLFLIYYTFYLNRKYYPLLKNFIVEIVRYQKTPKVLHFKKFIREIHEFKKTALAKLDLGIEKVKYSDDSEMEYHILVRSEGKKITDPESGKKDFIKYRQPERALLKIDFALQEFTKAGFNVSSFQPGAKGIWDQINFFNKTGGIITIRGAELANIFWMRPGSKVIILNHYNNNTSSPANGLAHILGLKCHELSGSLSYRQELNETLINQLTDILKE